MDHRAIFSFPLISSIYLDPEELENHNKLLQEKYARIEAQEVLCEEFMMEDADIVLVGFGIISRILKTAVERLREEGIRVGMFRPITLFPFPKRELYRYINRIKKIWVVEMNNGQMIDDVNLALKCKAQIEFYNRMGGVVPTTDEIIQQIKTSLVN